MNVPRPYQRSALSATTASFEKHQRVIVVMATGLGKTVWACELIRHRLQHGRAMFLAHRDELISQACNKIAEWTGVIPEIEKGDQWADQHWQSWKSPVIVSSIQTQNSRSRGAGGKRRMCRFNPMEFGTLILDECHRSVSNSWLRAIEHYSQNPDLKIAGITATPKRLDKKAMKTVYQDAPFVYEIGPAIEDGWLVAPRQHFLPIDGLDLSGIKPKRGDLTGEELEAYLLQNKVLLGMADAIFRESAGRKTLVFTASVNHAHMMTEILNRPGYMPGCARVVDAKTDSDERRQTVKDFAFGEFSHLLNCGCFLEGYDDPGIEVVAMCRPTKSESLYRQMLGRGTRPLPGTVDGIEEDEDQNHLGFDGATEQAAIRRRRIRESAKPYVDILDFVGNAGAHSLISCVDVLAGNTPKAVVEEAAAIIRRSGRAMTVEEAISEAKEERERKRAEEARRRAHVTAKASYRKIEVDPFRGPNRRPERKPGWWSRNKPASESQIALLEKLGAQHEGALTVHEASALIDNLKMQQRPSHKQQYHLRRLGLNPEMPLPRAKPILDIYFENNKAWPHAMERPNHDGTWPSESK